MSTPRPLAKLARAAPLILSLALLGAAQAAPLAPALPALPAPIEKAWESDFVSSRFSWGLAVKAKRLDAALAIAASAGAVELRVSPPAGCAMLATPDLSLLAVCQGARGLSWEIARISPLAASMDEETRLSAFLARESVRARAPQSQVYELDCMEGYIRRDMSAGALSLAAISYEQQPQALASLTLALGDAPSAQRARELIARAPISNAWIFIAFSDPSGALLPLWSKSLAALSPAAFEPVAQACASSAEAKRISEQSALAIMAAMIAPDPSEPTLLGERSDWIASEARSALPTNSEGAGSLTLTPPTGITQSWDWIDRLKALGPLGKARLRIDRDGAAGASSYATEALFNPMQWPLMVSITSDRLGRPQSASVRSALTLPKTGAEQQGEPSEPTAPADPDPAR